MTKNWVMMLVCGIIVCACMLAWVTISSNMTAVANTTDEIAMRGFSPSIVANSVKYSVVYIDIYYYDDASGDSESISSGTGFVYDPHHIVTAYHVIEEAFYDNNIHITIITDYGTYCQGHITDGSKKLDVAVIEVDIHQDCHNMVADHGPLIPVSTSTHPLNVGDWVIGVGYGSSTPDIWPTYTLGMISRIGHYIAHDAALGPGSSGAPLYDMYGNVIGMAVEGTRNEVINLAFAIPIDEVIDAVEHFIQYADDHMEKEYDDVDKGMAMTPEEASAMSVLSDGTNVMIMATEPMAGEQMIIDVVFKDREHVNYDIVVMQGDEEVLNAMGAHQHEGMGSHQTSHLPTSDPVDITITFQGYGIDEMTGPINEEIVFAQVVPDN